jgi:hypothetical protein
MYQWSWKMPEPSAPQAFHSFRECINFCSHMVLIFCGRSLPVTSSLHSNLHPPFIVFVTQVVGCELVFQAVSYTLLSVSGPSPAELMTTVLSHMRLPQPGGPGRCIYIPQEQGCPVIPQGSGFPFCRLLRWSWSSKSCYDRRSVSQYVVASSSLWNLWPDVIFCLNVAVLSQGCPLWREIGSIFCQSFSSVFSPLSSWS